MRHIKFSILYIINVKKIVCNLYVNILSILYACSCKRQTKCSNVHNGNNKHNAYIYLYINICKDYIYAVKGMNLNTIYMQHKAYNVT